MAANLLTTSQVAHELGVSRQHVVNMCERGELAFVMVGSHRRIPQSAIGRVSLRPEQVRSLWLHRAVLGHVAVDPSGVLAHAQENLERWRGVHRADSVATRYLDRWQVIIEQGPEATAVALTDTSAEGCEMRVNSPFAGVLSTSERKAIMEVNKLNKEPETSVA